MVSVTHALNKNKAYLGMKNLWTVKFIFIDLQCSSMIFSVFLKRFIFSSGFDPIEWVSRWYWISKCFTFTSSLDGAVGQSGSELKLSFWKLAWWRIWHEHPLNIGNFFSFCFWNIEDGVNDWNEAKTTKNEKCISSNGFIKNWISETNQCICQPVH